MPTSAHTYALFIRTHWLDKLGLSVPKTWDEIKKVAHAFTFDDPDGNGKNNTYGFTMRLSTTRGYASAFFSSYIWQAGGNYLVETQAGKFKGALVSKTAKTLKILISGLAS